MLCKARLEQDWMGAIIQILIIIIVIVITAEVIVCACVKVLIIPRSWNSGFIGLIGINL